MDAVISAFDIIRHANRCYFTKEGLTCKYQNWPCMQPKSLFAPPCSARFISIPGRMFSRPAPDLFQTFQNVISIFECVPKDDSVFVMHYAMVLHCLHSLLL